MITEHCFAKAEGGIECIDFKLTGSYKTYGRFRRDGKPTLCVSDEYDISNLGGLKSYFNNSNVPKKGDALYVSPFSKWAINDLRNNYTLKRNPDTGDYNVFASVPKSKARVYMEFWVAVPSMKLMIADVRPHDDYGWKVFAESYGYSIPDGTLIYSGQPQTRMVLYWTPESYRQLLKGELKKPCISADKLKLYSENELTADTLRLCYELGKDYSSEATEKLVFQMKVLNQYNWREYPYLVGLVFDRMIFYNQVYGMRKQKSKYPKPIQEMLEVSFDPYNTMTLKEAKLVREFIDQLMNVGELRFTSFKDWQNKLSEFRIPEVVFTRLYDCTMKIKPRDLNEENDIVS